MSAIEAIRYDQQKVAREHEADQLRIDRITKICETLDKNFNTYVIENMEVLRMHDEEFISRVHNLKNKQLDVDLKVF